MQAPTHILAGVLLLEVFQSIFPNSPIWLQVLVVFPLSFASHYLIDPSAIITYHPPEADWKDPFWVTYHVFVYIGAIICLVFFLVEYWWAIIAANLVDIIDWGILRGIFKKGPVLHTASDKVRKFLYKNTPNWTYKKWTIIIEFGIVGVLLTLIIILR